MPTVESTGAGIYTITWPDGSHLNLLPGGDRAIAAEARKQSPLRRAWLWCKRRPWLVFIAGIVTGQALVALGRTLAP